MKIVYILYIMIDIMLFTEKNIMTFYKFVTIKHAIPTLICFIIPKET
jgi:hypothetical protein